MRQTHLYMARIWHIQQIRQTHTLQDIAPHLTLALWLIARMK